MIELPKTGQPVRTDETRRWWRLDKDDEVAGAVFSAVSRIGTQLQRRRADDALYMQMYGSQDVVGHGESDQAVRRYNGPSDGRRRTLKREIAKLKFNLVGSVVNTAAAHIASKRPKVRFVTDDADWGLMRKAQGAEQIVKGVFDANDMYRLGREAFMDAAISSIGGVYVYSEGGKVKIERVFPGEILVDHREGYYGCPRTMYRVRIMDRQVVSEVFGKDVPATGTGSGGQDPFIPQLFDWLDYDHTIDQVLVVESWRLGAWDPDKGGHRPGQYVCAAPGVLLGSREWTRQRFPFAFLRWESRQVGFYGRGIVEELRGHQRALNYLHLKIADMIHNNSRSKFIVFDGTDGRPGVNPLHINNDPTTALRVRHGAQAPMQFTANAVPPEVFAYRREIIQDGYALIGLSQLRATGQVPKGVESGAAIREVEDTGSRRWANKTQAYEQFFIDTAELVVDEMREMAERGESPRVKVSHRKGPRTKLELLDFSDFSLEDNEYHLDLTPASTLPDSTAGRTQTVQDWYAAGFIDVQEAKQLLDFPDLEAFKSMDLSAYEVVLDTIERIVEDGEYFPPEPTDDLQLAIKLATLSVNKFRLRRLPEQQPEHYEMLLLYLDELRGLMEMAAAPAQAAASLPQQGAAPAGPTAAGPAAPSPAAAIPVAAA